MKIVRINSVALENFQATKSYLLALNGRDAEITAPNGIGKTTIANAIHWVFLDCDAMGNGASKNAWWKPRDKENNPVHRLETVAEITLSIDGKSHTFKRMAKENWKRPKGSSTETFETHTSVYWLDGEKFETETEFFRRVEKLLPVAFLPWMINPLWFASWTDQDRMKGPKTSSDDQRRAILFEICGDVSEQSVIDATPDLAPLRERGDRTVAQWASIQKDNRNALLKERDALPALINEGKLNRSEVPAGDHAAILIERKRIADVLRTKKAQAESGGHVGELSLELQRIEGQILTRKQALQGAPNPARTDAIVTRRKVQDDIDLAESMQTKLVREIQEINADLKRIQFDIEAKLRQGGDAHARLQSLDSKRFEGKTTCPSCGQDLPEERVAAATESFNTDLAKQKREAKAAFDKIRLEEGPALRAREAAIIGKDGIGGTLAAKQGDLSQVETILQDLGVKLAAIIVGAVEVVADPEADAEYQTLTKRREEKTIEMKTARTDAASVIAKIAEELADVEARVTETQGWIAKIEANASIDLRIRKHETRQKELGGILEAHDLQLYLCEQYTLAHAQMSEHQVNDGFNVIDWKLFNVLINGGIEPRCKPTLNGSEKLSDGEKILAGLDICRFFQRQQGISVPILVDRAESYTGEYPVDCQTIRLRAIENDLVDGALVPAPKELRVHYRDAGPIPTKALAANPEPVGAGTQNKLF